MLSFTQIIHQEIAKRHYHHAIDFTMGNGHDTLALSKVSDHVYSFDIQQQAIDATKKMIDCDHVDLILDSHENFDQYIESFDVGIFNLGYLPSGNHEITTIKDITLKTLQKALEHLLPGGYLYIAVYIGHDHGEEGSAVDAFCGQLDKHYNVMKLCMMNKKNAPYLIMIEKKD